MGESLPSDKDGHPRSQVKLGRKKTHVLLVNEFIWALFNFVWTILTLFGPF